MNRKFVKDFLTFYTAGWRPYTASKPADSVYERLGCPYAGAKKTPFWFVRGEHFLCVTCDKHCALVRPEGVILPLPLEFPQEKTGNEFNLTPGEMVSRKSLLRVAEAAYCLNISERKVYEWIADGRLRRTKDSPVRIPSEDVMRCMQDFED